MRRRHAVTGPIAATAVALTMLLAAACSGSGPPPCVEQQRGPGGVAATHAGRTRCPSNPLLGVYDPSRLKVKQACVWFDGTVTASETRKDGDRHLDVKPDPGFDSLLNKGNKKDQDGALVVEIMPGQEFPIPAVGDHVGFFGTWVHDKHNDWNELHPVWTIAYGVQASYLTSLPPAVPEYRCSADD